MSKPICACGCTGVCQILATTQGKRLLAALEAFLCDPGSVDDAIRRIAEHRKRTDDLRAVLGLGRGA